MEGIKTVLMGMALTFGAGCHCVDWDGAVLVPVGVRVTDSVTGKPVAGVAATPGPSTPDRARVLTDDSGKAKVQAMTGMGGKDCLLYQEVDVWPSTIRLRLERTGYAPLETTVSDRTMIRHVKILGLGGRASFRKDVQMTRTLE